MVMLSRLISQRYDFMIIDSVSYRLSSTTSVITSHCFTSCIPGPAENDGQRLRNPYA